MIKKILMFALLLVFGVAAVGCNKTPDETMGESNPPASQIELGQMECKVRFSYKDEPTDADFIADNGVLINEVVYVIVDFTFNNPTTTNDYADFVMTIPAMKYISAFKFHSGELIPKPKDNEVPDAITGEMIPAKFFELSILVQKETKVPYRYVFKMIPNKECNNLSIEFSLHSKHGALTQGLPSKDFIGSISFNIIPNMNAEGGNE